MIIRVLVADDHRLFRDGVRTLLEREADLEVVGVAADGQSVLTQVDTCRPNVVLMDVSMPGLNGLETTRRLRADHPDIAVLMLSMHADHRFVVEALRAGALGYVPKDCEISELRAAIRTVNGRQLYLSPSLAGRVVRDYLALMGDRPDSAFSVLSAREREVLQMLAEGRTAKDIAGTLGVSIKTVESHRKNIMDKLDIHSVAELTKYAIREGLTHLE
ncbi:MAG: response regulator transcription factor [Thermoanaerobaculia bacterium]|jgi:DNA-binding NarL/FixJ family response regulator